MLKGKTKGEIRESLLSKGWPNDTVDEELKQQDNEKFDFK